MQGMENQATATWNDLLAGKSDPTTLYFLSEDKYFEMAKDKLRDTMCVCEFDNFKVLFIPENGVV